LTVLLLCTACKKSLEEPSPITIIATVDYGNGEVIQLVYQGKVIWQSEPGINSLAYREEGDFVYVNYISANGKPTFLTFKNGQVEKI